ncbi:MAG: tRNA pseudouridine(55) synthase TruB [Candidatus Stygibacter frigidus]|nr:tRNA pseudouridine(55) synthase TruB [Candidatus Stygibacter frigidus]
MNNCGFLLIDKPADITSFQVISSLRKITSIKRIGHTGTLDPFATGLLPICIGPATRLASFISSSRKTYLATMKFGLKTNTGDVTGETILTQPIKKLDTSELESAVKEILAIKEQTPPQYSAIKVNGKRAYELARKGAEVVLKPRPIIIYDFEIINTDEDTLTYQTTVSKGTYIRTLSEQFAEITGNIATTIELKRVAVDKLLLEDAVELADLTPDNWRQYLISPVNILTLPQVMLNDEDAAKFMHGRMIESSDLTEDQYIVIRQSTSRTLGIARKNDGNILKPEIVLPE